jgi:replicative DNA helicase
LKIGDTILVTALHQGDGRKIEQIADNIILLHRPSYYNIFDSGDVKSEDDWQAEFIIAKNRNGPVGSIPAVWLPHLMSFKEPTWERTANAEF